MIKTKNLICLSRKAKMFPIYELKNWKVKKTKDSGKLKVIECTPGGKYYDRVAIFNHVLH